MKWCWRTVPCNCRIPLHSLHHYSMQNKLQNEELITAAPRTIFYATFCCCNIALVTARGLGGWGEGGGGKSLSEPISDDRRAHDKTRQYVTSRQLTSRQATSSDPYWVTLCHTMTLIPQHILMIPRVCCVYSWNFVTNNM